MYHSARCATNERGQTTIALAGVVVLTLLLIAAIATISQAMVHRARARNAADAVALATVADPASAPGLGQWYRSQGVDVTVDVNGAFASSGPSQAAAWAETGKAVPRAPVLVAVVARAEQLIGASITVRRWQPTSIDVPVDQATTLRTVATDLGLCEGPSATQPATVVRFELC